MRLAARSLGLAVALGLAAALAFVGSAAGPAVAASDAAEQRCPGPSATDHPELVAVYPNPVPDGDRGEFVTLAATATWPGNWSVSDGESAVRLPGSLEPGRVRASPDPASVPAEGPRVVGLDGHLSLSNAGERVELRCDGRLVDAVTYPRASEAEVWRGEYRPLGATDFGVAVAPAASVRAFALPDDGDVPFDLLDDATRRLYLAGYTITSERTVEALLRAAARGVDVRVLVEGGPVGGASSQQARLLDRLRARGVAVTVLDGSYARYRYHHAKYAVVDDRLLVASENWEPDGLGGRGNRGWGVVVESPALATRLAGVFAADTGWRDGRPWREYRRDAAFQDESDGGSAFPRRFAPVDATGTTVRLLAAPDNAGDAIVALLASADEEILIELPSVDPDHRFLQAALDAARRGVRVRVLLSGAWYAREDNRRTVEKLQATAAAEALPLTAKLAEPRSRYQSIHVKGVVVDRERALVGSLNWNPTSETANREVAVIVDDPAVGRYYARIFTADWRGAAWRLSGGVIGLLGLCGLLAVCVLRRAVRFEVD